MPSWGYQLTFCNRKSLEDILNNYEIKFVRLQNPFLCNCTDDYTDGTGWCANCGCERIDE